MTDDRTLKVQLLITQKKFAEAERLLKNFLHDDASNVVLMSLLAEVYLQQDKTAMAKQIINNAIGLAPDVAYFFHLRARIALLEEQYDAAESDAAQAMQIDPADADYYALLAHIKFTRKQYEEALSLADRALAIDSENLLALNTRGAALLKLNKKQDSFATIEGALREDPNNAFTHANYGWAQLEKGDRKKALEHFKEALKNDPSFGYAQAGMVEALKASNIIYRFYLKYAMWIGNLTAKYQWAVIIGFYFGVKFLRGLANANESLRPFLLPVVIALSVVAFSTWIIGPLGNLFLRLNRYGNFLLDKEEKLSATFVGIGLLACIGGVVTYLATSDIKFLSLSAFGLGMMIPCSVMFTETKPKHILLITTIILAMVGAGAVVIALTTGELFTPLTLVFVLGILACQWGANFFLIKAGNK